MRWGIAISAALWVLIGAVVIGLWGPKPSAPTRPIVAAGAKPNAELGRCRLLGEAAKDDLACREVWASARARFFDGGRS